MKKIFLLCLSSILLAPAFAQNSPQMPEADKSPMDMSYFPENYPILKIQNKAKDPMIARIIYSRPQKNGRKIFGELLEYGKLWRLGANEATEIDFYKDVKINGKKIVKGRYTLYAIPYETKWTVILNKDTDTWGGFKYDESKDVIRVDVPVTKKEEITEYFSMAFEKTKAGCSLDMAWDDVFVSLPISL